MPYLYKSHQCFQWILQASFHFMEFCWKKDKIFFIFKFCSFLSMPIPATASVYILFINMAVSAQVQLLINEKCGSTVDVLILNCNVEVHMIIYYNDNCNNSLSIGFISQIRSNQICLKWQEMCMLKWKYFEYKFVLQGGTYGIWSSFV